MSEPLIFRDRFETSAAHVHQRSCLRDPSDRNLPLPLGKPLGDRYFTATWGGLVPGLRLVAGIPTEF
jgi:hypothetical protein